MRRRTDMAYINLNRNAKKHKFIVNALLYALMTLLAVILLFPYAYMVSKSLMTGEEVVDPTIRLLPEVPQFKNYLRIFQNEDYLNGFIHTLIIVGCNCIIVPLSASVIAFSFAKLKWVGRGFMFAIMLGTMMLPGVVTQLSLYAIYVDLNWINTLYPFIIPNLFGGGALYIFLIRQFMLGIPRDMDNAAKIDGANAFVRYWSIVLPLCKPVLIYVVVNVFISYWGDYYGPFVYMRASYAPKTLAQVVFENSMEKDAATYNANMRMCGGVIMSIVPAILFAIFQKQLIEGVVMTGLKD